MGGKRPNDRNLCLVAVIWPLSLQPCDRVTLRESERKYDVIITKWKRGEGGDTGRGRRHGDGGVEDATKTTIKHKQPPVH